MGGNGLDRFVPEAEPEYLCAEDVLVRGKSPVLFGNSHSFARAVRYTSPADTD
jgi:hypothetical protein